jgi:hypothetical protein
MIRTLSTLGALLIALALAAPTASFAQDDDTPAPVKKAQPKRHGKVDPAADAADPAPGEAKPMLVGTYGDWGAYMTQVGKGRVCYALAKPKDREPSNLHRDPAYVFISTRPAEGVHNEISVIMGFPLKEGAIEGGADIDGTKFDLIAKGENAWVKNAAEEPQVIDVMRKGSKLIVTAPSKRGKVTTDTYLLDGLALALDKVTKSCPPRS